MNFRSLLVLTAFATAFVPFSARADQRSYVWTYEYLTVPAGQGEFEAYTTLSSPDTDDLQGRVTTEQKFELEVGMNDHFDFSVYQSFSQAPGAPLQYDGFQLRARHRFGNKGQRFVDPLVYFEYGGVPDFSTHEIETKLILARDFSRLNVSLNPTMEIKLGNGREIDVKYALGASYALSPLLRLGLEAKGSADGHYIGPVIAHGSGRFWVTLGSAFAVVGVDPGKTRFQTRLLLGVGL